MSHNANLATAVAPGAMRTDQATSLLPACPNNFDPRTTNYATLATGYTPIKGSLLRTVDGSRAWTYTGQSGYNGWQEETPVPPGDNDYAWPKLLYGHDGIPAGGWSDKGHFWIFGDHDFVLGSHDNPNTSAYHLTGNDDTAIFSNGITEELATVGGMRFKINGPDSHQEIVWSITNWVFPELTCWGRLAVRPRYGYAQGSNRLQEWRDSANAALSGVSGDGLILAANGAVAAPGISWLTDPTCGIYHSGVGATGNVAVAINGLQRLSVGLLGIIASSTSGGSSTQQVHCVDMTAQAAGVGGGVGMLGSYSGLTQTTGALIRAEKVNATDGDYSFNFAIYTRNNGSVLAKTVTVSNLGEVTIHGLAGTGSRAVVADANGKLSAP